jgi:hypothetical protein
MFSTFFAITFYLRLMLLWCMQLYLFRGKTTTSAYAAHQLATNDNDFERVSASHPVAAIVFPVGNISLKCKQRLSFAQTT